MRTRSSASWSSARNRVDMSLAPDLRRAADALDHGVARLGLVGEPIDASVEELGIGLDPVVEERGPQPVHRRAPDPEVGVAPLVLVPGVALPLVGDADAAGEPDRLVDDHDLAVGPVVHLRRLQPVQRPEPADAHARVLHHRRSRPGRSECAPHASSRTRTRTPDRARSESASANAVPISPRQ